jgi:hypothetical protein
MIEQDPRITEGPTFFASLYAWMKRAALEINAKAPTNSPTFTGDPQAPTPAVSDNDTSIATTAWVRAAMSDIATTAGFVASLAGAAGYIKFPSWLGGWIAQWGSTVAAVDGSGTINITLPITFPTANRAQVCINGDAATGLLLTAIAGTPSTSVFSVQSRVANTGAAATGSVRINWAVFGH